MIDRWAGSRGGQRTNGKVRAPCCLLPGRPARKRVAAAKESDGSGRHVNDAGDASRTKDTKDTKQGDSMADRVQFAGNEMFADGEIRAVMPPILKRPAKMRHDTCWFKQM